MNVSATIPPIVHIRRSRLVGLLGLAAAGAAAVTFVALAFGGNTGSGQAQPEPIVVSSPIPMSGYLDGITSRPTVVPQEAPFDAYVQSIGALAWHQQSAAVHEHRDNPTRAEILSSMSPQTRHYVEALLALTPKQLAAGAAGSP